MNWPQGMRVRPIVTWPGPSTKFRRRSDFKAGWGSTLELLTRELGCLGARGVVLQIALREQDFRIDGFPRAGARPDHPGVILSMESKFGPLSYPCDRFDNWQDNIRAIALALEALRKVDRYGVTKRGEQYRGWRQLEAGAANGGFGSADEALRWLHHTAGYQPPAADAGPVGDSVRKLLRTVALRVHPDHGGTPEQWHRFEEAKRLLGKAGHE